MEQLAIFHYHLLKGGVGNVIALTVQALCEHNRSIKAVRLVTGRRENADEAYRELLPVTDKHGNDLQLDVYPPIDYLEEHEADNHMPADRMARELYERYQGMIWWVHNYQLGKNPLFTEALLTVADEHPDQRMVFQIHDFPECSRYGNLAFLNRHITRPAYPIRPNLRYVVINGRDRNLLQNAGIPSEHLFLLNNPVDASPLDRSGAASVRNRLGKLFGSSFPRYNEENPIVLYPIRAIRRKNVLELGLLTELSRKPMNLVVTLPGVSTREKPYSDTVARAYAEGLVAGLWGIGTKLDETDLGFMDLVGSADLIAASSVQEGFGYLYINAITWGFPLFARRLDILDGIMDIFDLPHVRFYERVPVPLNKEHRASLEKAYGQRIDELPAFLPERTVKRLRGEIGELLSGDTVGFSYLDPDSQYRTLARAHQDEAYAAELRSLNEPLLDDLERLVTQSAGVTAADVDRRFTFAGFAETVESIIGSFGAEAPSATKAETSVQERLVDSFAEKEYIRLLYT